MQITNQYYRYTYNKKATRLSGFVGLTDKISNQLQKDIQTLSDLKRYISSH